MLLISSLIYSNSVHAQGPAAMAASLSLGSALDFGANYLMAPLADSTSSASAIWDFADWETRRFNPYKAEDVKFPIQIDFADSTFALPMARKMVVTSRYGWRNGELHRGIDLDLITGDDVYALLGGKVRYVKYHTGHGKTVVIRHANGLETVYAHLSKQLVKVNDIVKKGHLIGKGGTSGNARGSHLHLEVRFQGRTLNPESFFDFTKSDHIRAKRLWVTKAYANPRNYSSVRPSRLPVLTNYPTPKIEKPKSEVAVKEKPIPREGADQSIQPKKEIPIEVASQEPKRLSINGNVKYNQKNPYVIKYGDTLYSLARAHHTTVDGICKENGIPDAFKIKVGQKVILDF